MGRHRQRTLGACAIVLARPFAYCLPAGGCGTLIGAIAVCKQMRFAVVVVTKVADHLPSGGYISRSHCFGSAGRTALDTHLLPTDDDDDVDDVEAMGSGGE